MIIGFAKTYGFRTTSLTRNTSLEPIDAPKRPTAVPKERKEAFPQTLDAIAYWDDFDKKADKKIHSQERTMIAW